MMKVARLKVTDKVTGGIQGSSMRFFDKEAVNMIPLSQFYTVCSGSLTPGLPTDAHGCIVSVYCQEGVSYRNKLCSSQVAVFIGVKKSEHDLEAIVAQAALHHLLHRPLQVQAVSFSHQGININKPCQQVGSVTQEGSSECGLAGTRDLLQGG